MTVRVRRMAAGRMGAAWMAAGMLAAGASGAGGQPPAAPGTGASADKVRICAVQFAARPPAEAAGAMKQFIEKAAADGAKLVVFPALSMPGGEAVEKAMGEAVAKSRITMVAGVRETGPGGAPDSRAVAYDTTGRVVARRRKGDPITQPGVFDAGYGRVAILLGGEVASAERLDAMKPRDIDVVVWLSDRPDPVDAASVELVMLRTGACMAASNSATGGGSVVAEWPRSILNASKTAGEAVVRADVSFGQARQARAAAGGASSAVAAVSTPVAPPPSQAGGGAGMGSDEAIDESKLIPVEWLHWHADPSTAMTDAKRQSKRIIVYFVHPDAKRSAWIENRIFRDKDVAALIGGGYILAKVDMATQSQFASRLGVFKGGVVNVYAGDGAYLGQASNIKSPQDLIKLLSK